MQTTTVGDVMTRDVIAVGPRTPVKDIIEVLAGRGISAVPVLDDHGQLLGVVSEADLLRKQEHRDNGETGPPRLARRRVREEWRRAAGAVAAELMTSPGLTVGSATLLPSAARLLARAGVRRLFVVENGRVAGVLARRDLLHEYLRPDQDIQAEIEQHEFSDGAHPERNVFLVTVEHGVVLLTGQLEYEQDVAAASRLIREIPGVVEVRNRLTYAWNSPSTAV